MNKLGITPKLTLIFILFAGAVLVGLGVPAYSNGRTALETATVSELLSTALEKQAALDTWVANRQQSIGDIANQAQLRESVTALMAAAPGSSGSGSAHTDLVADLGNWAGEGHRFLSMEVIDAATGRVIAATDDIEEGKFREEQAYFINGLKAAYVQNPYYDLSQQRPSMTAAAPVLSPDGRVIAVLAGPLNMDEMNAIIQRRSGLHQTDDAYLVNTSNLFVTQPRLNPDPAVLQRGVHTEAVNACLAHNSGVVSAPDYRDVPAFIVYRWLPERQLCLITKLDQDEALTPARVLATTMALIGGLVLLVGSIIAFGLSRSIARPVRQLVQGAEQIGLGNLDHRIEVKSGDEIGKLGTAFNAMASAIGEKETQLRKWATDLELRVEERTIELRASEERYRILSETSPDMIFVIDRQDKVQYVNNLAARQFGKTPEQVIGKERTELFPPGIAENQALGLQQVLNSSEPFSSESQIAFPGGHLWLETQLVPLLDEAGKVGAVMGVSRDVTERKRAEAEIIRRNHELTTLYSISSATAQSLDLDETLNRAVESTLGALDVETGGIYLVEPDGETLTLRVHRGVSDEIARNLHCVKMGEGMSGRAAAEKQTVVLDVQDYPSQRLAPYIIQERFQTLVSIPLLSAGEAVGALNLSTRRVRAFPPEELELLTAIGQQLGSAVQNALLYQKLQSELDERTRAEETLRDTEARYRGLFEQSPYGILLIDLETGKTIEANEIAHKQLGYTREEFNALRISDYETVENPEETAKRMQKVISEGSDDFETIQRTKSGEIRNVHVWAMTIHLSNRVVFYTIFQDITERKQAEDEIARRNHELSVLYKVSQGSLQSLDLQIMLDHVTPTMIQELGGAAGGIYVLEPDGVTMTLRSYFGHSEEFVNSVRQIKRGEGI